MTSDPDAVTTRGEEYQTLRRAINHHLVAVTFSLKHTTTTASFAWAVVVCDVKASRVFVSH
ncbi:hypothetical protein D3C81_2142380 [compost metagenome]